jgi:hypothetical protein
MGLQLLERLQVVDSEQWSTCRSITFQRVGVFARRYNQMARAVPFASLLALEDLSSLLSKEPILLLAAILTGSSSDPDIERQADKLFRHILADRVIVKGEKSLELLRSLLTYLTWYHHRFDPATMQFYQLLQLANGMVADLGLPRKYAKRSPLVSDPGQDLDEIRALLLCYYLNCGGSVLGYDRLETMHCFESVRSGAEIMARQGEHPLDHNAPALVDLLHTVAGQGYMSNTLDRQVTTRAPKPDEAMLEWKSLHLHARLPQPIRSSLHFCSAYILLKSSGCQEPTTGTIGICQVNFQEMLSGVLNQEIIYITSMGIVEWAHTITTLFLLARLETHRGRQNTDTASERRLSVHDYVDRFRTLLATLRGASRDTEENIAATEAPHLFGWLERLLTAVIDRSNASQISQPTAAEAKSHRESAYELVNSFLSESEKASLQLQQNTRGEMELQPAGEDFWSTFMSDWLNW